MQHNISICRCFRSIIILVLVFFSHLYAPFLYHLPFMLRYSLSHPYACSRCGLLQNSYINSLLAQFYLFSLSTFSHHISPFIALRTSSIQKRNIISNNTYIRQCTLNPFSFHVIYSCWRGRNRYQYIYYYYGFVHALSNSYLFVAFPFS